MLVIEDVLMIIGLGDYKGGELNLQELVYDIRNRFLIFDGSLQTHWTEPFIGERYTITYYTI